MVKINIKELKQDICRYSNLLYQRGLVGAAGGNVSVKKGNSIYVTAGGKSLRDIKPEDIVEVDTLGDLIDNNTGLIPSKETSLHLNIYKARKDIDCVIHIHPVHTTAFSIRGKTVPMITSTSRLKLKKIPLVGYAEPGSKKLSQLVYQKVLEMQEDLSALMLEAHGLIVFANGMENCFNIAELVEETAKIAYVSGKIGQ